MAIQIPELKSVTNQVLEAKKLTKLSHNGGSEYWYWKAVERCGNVFQELLPVLVPFADGNILYNLKLSDMHTIYDAFYEIHPAFYEAISLGGVITQDLQVIYYIYDNDTKNIDLPDGIKFGICGHNRRNLIFHDYDIYQLRNLLPKDFAIDNFGSAYCFLLKLPLMAFDDPEYKSPYFISDIWK